MGMPTLFVSALNRLALSRSRLSIAEKAHIDSTMRSRGTKGDIFSESTLLTRLQTRKFPRYALNYRSTEVDSSAAEPGVGVAELSAVQLRSYPFYFFSKS